MYTQIASLQRVRVKGHSYWRIVESRRVNGKPRAIPILHLGTANQLLDRLLHAPEGRLRLRSFAHGDVAALSGDVDIAGSVGGSVAAWSGDVSLDSSARVDGDISVLSGSISGVADAHVGGNVVRGPSLPFSMKPGVPLPFQIKPGIPD